MNETKIAEEQKPLVTISMITYNQEKYVRDAVRGMLAQTYEPLEIVISDDCSTDRTWMVVLEETEKYQRTGGNHRIVLNRNDRNLGIARNAQIVSRLRHGIITVGQGGDDISFPDRVMRIVEAWNDAGRDATVIFHDGIKIDLDGKPIGTIGKRDVDNPLGACMAYYSEKLAGKFKAIEEDGAFDDHVFARRAILFGKALILPDKLMKYRVGSGVSSVLFDRRVPELRSAVGRAASYRQTIRDVNFIHENGDIDDAMCSELTKKYSAQVDRMEFLIQLMSGKDFHSRWSAFRNLYFSKLLVREAFLRLPYLLPKSIGDAIYKVYDRFLRLWRNKLKA